MPTCRLSQFEALRSEGRNEAFSKWDRRLTRDTGDARKLRFRDHVPCYLRSTGFMRVIKYGYGTCHRWRDRGIGGDRAGLERV